MVFIKTYEEPPLNKKEILRYIGSNQDQDTIQLVEECISKVKSVIKYKVCYCELCVSINNGLCDFGVFKVTSSNLAKNLKGCKQVIVFGATLGIELDRIVAKHSKLSPTKALIFQGIGAERTESLCNVFCEEIAKEFGVSLRPRFSPGYGDLPLETQRQIFSVLDCERKIGITLNDSLLMSPTKSVTAFIGLEDDSNLEV
ncbi:MAG: Vitamin B12 dependent methionine synthase activation subunit [Clostridia bacterium]|nr:Vitamin B12 dependent methionine synthase activation subunit [Clostridia bacterium]